VSPIRREFIKRVGIALGSLMVARCALPAGKSTSTPEDDVEPEVARLALVAFHRERLRSCWLRLDWLEEQAGDWSDYEKGDRALEQLKTEHRLLYVAPSNRNGLSGAGKGIA
jgi:hypothetical protein